MDIFSLPNLPLSPFQPIPISRPNSQINMVGEMDERKRKPISANLPLGEYDALPVEILEAGEWQMISVMDYYSEQSVSRTIILEATEDNTLINGFLFGDFIIMSVKDGVQNYNYPNTFSETLNKGDSFNLYSMNISPYKNSGIAFNKPIKAVYRKQEPLSGIQSFITLEKI